jgi:DNA mismatch repair protein MutS2
MDNQALKILEFDQAAALVRRGAQTPMGQRLVDSLAPIPQHSRLIEELGAVAECVKLRSRGVAWSFSDLLDPSDSIARLKVQGTVLESLSILELARLVEQAMSARASILAERDESPTLWKVVAELPREMSSLTARISSKIFPSGELDDRASPELARIRHEIARLRSSITRTLENLMRRSEEVVQDELVTVRNDRFVIPIKADHRARIPGVAHGFSSSGATAFVEPMETVESNNQLQNLREEEQREITRILFGLTEELRANLEGIEVAAAAVTQLDFINAKALFYQKFDCSIPIIVLEESILELTAARHPLLEENLRATGGYVVPVSFALDRDHDSMVISGANAGGKTVVLKTAGLLSLMALSGLPVPATTATIPFYSSVLADIGDHQSLAANLSTFTSHISNISKMMKLCEAPALVLLDEVGTGTDPEEGSALGVVVVDHFRKVCGAQVMATTHYSGLKMYASSEDGVMNASVEFDEKTLKPTYRLVVGVAGASSGLEIARRFGVPDEIVNRALSEVKESSRQATEYLNRIKREADEATALRIALDEERAAVAEKFSLLEKQAEKRERERQIEFQRELDRASTEFDRRARELVSAVQDQAERLKVEREAQKRAAELKREAQKAAATRGREGKYQAAAVNPSSPVRVIRDGQIVQNERATSAPEAEERYVPAAARDITVGDRVRLRSFGSIGIVDQIKDDTAEVRVKSLRLREKLENLELLQEVAPAKKEGGRFSKLRPTTQTEFRGKSANESSRSELNVIGQTTDEAVDAVDKFLDEAFLNNLSEVRIVHGHGTGALRRAISELLKEHPHVERSLPAPPNQGGAGATLVQLRQ